jgi:hypothetical protein
MRATRPPLDPQLLGAGLEELGRRVAEGRPEPVAEALWSTLRGARIDAPGGESTIAPPTTHPRETR